jgi:hypothetical protein
MLRSLLGLLAAVVLVVDCAGSAGPTWSFVVDLESVRLVVQG